RSPPSTRSRRPRRPHPRPAHEPGTPIPSTRTPSRRRRPAAASGSQERTERTMSINSALLAGVSGLVANSSALAAISDNIANVNTTAYKRNQVDFSTLVTSQAVKGEYSAGGVTGINKAFISQQGL